MAGQHNIRSRVHDIIPRVNRIFNTFDLFAVFLAALNVMILPQHSAPDAEANFPALELQPSSSQAHRSGVDSVETESPSGFDSNSDGSAVELACSADWGLQEESVSVVEPPKAGEDTYQFNLTCQALVQDGRSELLFGGDIQMISLVEAKLQKCAVCAQDPALPADGLGVAAGIQEPPTAEGLAVAADVAFEDLDAGADGGIDAFFDDRASRGRGEGEAPAPSGSIAAAPGPSSGSSWGVQGLYLNALPGGVAPAPPAVPAASEGGAGAMVARSCGPPLSLELWLGIIGLLPASSHVVLSLSCRHLHRMRPLRMTVYPSSRWPFYDCHLRLVTRAQLLREIDAEPAAAVRLFNLARSPRLFMAA